MNKYLFFEDISLLKEIGIIRSSDATVIVIHINEESNVNIGKSRFIVKNNTKNRTEIGTYSLTKMGGEIFKIAHDIPNEYFVSGIKECFKNNGLTIIEN